MTPTRLRQDRRKKKIENNEKEENGVESKIQNFLPSVGMGTHPDIADTSHNSKTMTMFLLGGVDGYVDFFTVTIT